MVAASGTHVILNIQEGSASGAGVVPIEGGPITPLHASPFAREPVTTHDRSRLGYWDHSVMQLVLADWGNEKRVTLASQRQRLSPLEPERRLFPIAFSPDDSMLLVASTEEGSLQIPVKGYEVILHPTDGAPPAQVTQDKAFFFVGFGARNTLVSAQRSDNSLNYELWTWTAAEGNQKVGGIDKNCSRAELVAFSPKGRSAAFVDELGAFTVIDMESGRVAAKQDHMIPIGQTCRASLRWATEASLLVNVCKGFDCSSRVISMTGETLSELGPVVDKQTRISPDGGYAVLSGGLYDLRNGMKVEELKELSHWLGDKQLLTADTEGLLIMQLP